MIKAVFIVSGGTDLRAQRIYDEQVVKETMHNFSDKKLTRPHEVFSALLPGQADRSELCSFVEAPGILPEGTKLVYRAYANLRFIFCIDELESALGIVDMIHVFVKILDKTFNDVSELNLVYNPHKLQYILDEIICDGMVIETSISEVCTTLGQMESI